MLGQGQPRRPVWERRRGRMQRKKPDPSWERAERRQQRFDIGVWSNDKPLGGVGQGQVDQRGEILGNMQQVGHQPEDRWPERGVAGDPACVDGADARTDPFQTPFQSLQDIGSAVEVAALFPQSFKFVLLLFGLFSETIPGGGLFE